VSEPELFQRRNEAICYARDGVPIPPAAWSPRRLRCSGRPDDRNRPHHAGLYLAQGLFRRRQTIVEFEHEEGLRAWRLNPEHVAAQKLARKKYYTEYHVQVCALDRESKFKAEAAAHEAATMAPAAQG